MTAAGFDALPPDRARELLLDVCSAPRWADAVVAARPFGSADALQEAAAAALDPVDLGPALAGHPRIGDRAAAGRSGHEQAAVAAAGDEVHATLAAGNAAYEERFGHVYLVCASGRTPADLLATLHARLGNDPATEVAVALDELRKINRLRLEGMIASA